MFNRKSSYALNKKDPNAIVYMDANEAIIRLTREDFASEEEFLKWKSLSDADYHASEKEDHVYANHSGIRPKMRRDRVGFCNSCAVASETNRIRIMKVMTVTVMRTA